LLVSHSGTCERVIECAVDRTVVETLISECVLQAGDTVTIGTEANGERLDRASTIGSLVISGRVWFECVLAEVAFEVGECDFFFSQLHQERRQPRW